MRPVAILALLATAVGAGCTPTGGRGQRPATQLRWVSPLAVEAVSPGQVGGVRWLRATASQPTRMVVWHDDGEQVRSTEVAPLAVEHEVAFVGFAPGPHQVWVELVNDAGERVSSEVVGFDEPGIPGLRVEVLAHDASRVGDGWLLAPLTLVGDEAPTYVVLLDEALRVAWWADRQGLLAEVQLDGHELVGTGGGALNRLDLLGHVTDTVVPALGEAHHDLVTLPDGSFWTLVERGVEVDAYPVAYDRLEDFAPARLRDSFVAHVGPDGETLAAVALADLLDTQKIGFNSLDFYPSEQWFDWNHANGLGIDPRDGGPVVSLRHLDAVVKLSADLQLEWILGAPEGWRAPWSDALLSAAPGLTWPLHPHAPEVLADGTLLLFDNRNDGHTPYTEPVTVRPTSRAVAYRVDAGRAEQLWSYDTTTTGPLFCAAVGDVDLDDAGRVLVDYGFVHFEGELDNEDAGRGARSIRWVEGFVEEAVPLLDVRLSTDPAVWPDGVHSYRVQRVPSRYGPIPAVAP